MSEGTKTTKLTLCICFYNAENFLNRCIDSFKDYLVDEIEVLLIDDGSTDNSVSIVNKYIRSYKQLKLVKHSENKGLSLARKTAVENTKTEYLMFLDADDEFISDPFSLFLSDSALSQYDIIEFSSVNEDGIIKSNNYMGYKKPVDSIEYLNDYFKLEPINVSLCSKVFKVKLFFPVSFSENFRIHEDNMAWPLILSRSKKIIRIEATVLKINSNPNSITRVRHNKNPRIHIANKLKIKSDFYAEWITHLETNMEDSFKNNNFHRFVNQLILYFSYYSSSLKLTEFSDKHKRLLKKYSKPTFFRYKFTFSSKSSINSLLMISGLKFTSYFLYYFSKLNIILNQKIRKVD